MILCAISIFFLFLVTAPFDILASGLNYGRVSFSSVWLGRRGTCGFEQSKYDPHYVAALSNRFMELPGACSGYKCIQVCGEKGSAVLKVSDTCLDCQRFDIVIADAIAQQLGRGRTHMNWKFIDCRLRPPGKVEKCAEEAEMTN